MNTTILRPWGYYTPVYDKGEISVQEITVKPQQKTELARRPRHKASWVVISGCCEVLLEDDISVCLNPHDHYLLPENTWYQLSNEGEESVKLIEIRYDA